MAGKKRKRAQNPRISRSTILPFARLPRQGQERLLSFLPINDRFHAAQASQQVRNMIHSRDMQVLALEEYLRAGAPPIPLEGRPFSLQTETNRLKELRKEIWREVLTSWTSVLMVARQHMKNLISTQVTPRHVWPSLVDKVIRSLPNDTEPNGFDDDVDGAFDEEAEKALVETFEARPALNREQESWTIVYLAMKLMACPKRVMRIVALLKFYPEYRDQCLHNPYCIVDWVDHGNRSMIPLEPEAVGSDLDSLPLPRWKQFCSWPFITGTEANPIDQRSAWYSESFEELKRQVKKAGFIPYVDHESNKDDSGICTYFSVEISIRHWSIILTGKSCVEIRFKR